MATKLYDEAPTLKMGEGPGSAQPRKLKSIAPVNGGATPSTPVLKAPENQGQHGALGQVQQQAPTFAQLQQQGRARPAPPPPPAPSAPAPSAPAPAAAPQPQAQPQAYSSGGSGVVNPRASGDVREATRAAILAQLANPAGFGSDEVQQWYERGAQDIDDQYSMGRTAAEEEMARRGLSASSIMGGRLADLNVQRRTAQVELRDMLGRQLAEELSAARDRAIQSGTAFDEFLTRSELEGQRIGVDRDRVVLDAELGRGRLSLDDRLGTERNAIDRDQLGEERRQFDLGYDLDRDKFTEDTRQFDEDLGLRRDDLGLRRDMFGEDKRQFDENMGQRRDEFDWQRDVDYLRWLGETDIMDPEFEYGAPTSYSGYPDYDPSRYF